MTPGFSVLVVSGVKNKYVKNAAEKSDFNKNDRIDQTKEWKALLGGIADEYGKGNIKYDTAKKYVDLSSNTSFVKKDELNNGYKEGFINGLNEYKNLAKTMIERKFLNTLFPNEAKDLIIIYAECGESDAKLRRSVNERKKLENECKKLENENERLVNEILEKSRKMNEDWESFKQSYRN